MRLVLGTRGSALARAQSGQVADRLRALGFEIEIREIKTTGDRLSELKQPIEGKGIFTKELDQALRDGRIAFAVHSLKDLPSEIDEDLALAAIPRREDPRDVLVSKDGRRLAELSPGSRIGTGSPRRAGQLLAARPDLVCSEARGNVDTRLRKLREGQWDAIVLARAGLRRLGRDGEATQVLEMAEMIPAVGQGALAIVTRAADSRTLREALDDPASRAAALCERRLLQQLEGGCRAPIAACAFPEGARLKLLAAVFSPDGTTFLREERLGDPARPEELGTETAEALKARGAAEIVAAARKG
jgi:hydroxymethylbilane synthase